MAKLVSSLFLVCIGIYIANNHPEIAAVMYDKFLMGINYVMAFMARFM